MRTQADHAEYDWRVGPDPDMVAGEQIAAELAALEREIGRAMIYEDLASNAAERVIQDDDACYILYGAANDAMMATIPLITRYRALLAQPGAQQEEGEEA